MANRASILVLGTGSVGRRHAKNLVALGAEVACMDPSKDRLEQAQREIPGITATFATLEESLPHAAKWTGVVVASPPSVHVTQALRAIRSGIPVLLEKPVSPDLASAQQLARAVRLSGVPLLLGYTYRWWPPLREIRDRVLSGVVGPLRHARITMSAHLADWHPWERYQDFFMAKRELGGGALLDESHFIDIMLWMFGWPTAISGRSERLSSLEITTDDNVDLLAIYPDNFRVSIHLDIYGRPHEKSVTVVGENGTLQCLFDPDVVRWSSSPTGDWTERPFDCERNDMFFQTAREFLDVATGKWDPSCTIEDGVRVLQCVEAVRASTARERTIYLGAPC